MKVKVLNKDANSIRFELSGINPTFSNMIRRAILTKVNAMAVENVEINKNTSALYNEILSHRIGMIPLTFDPKAYSRKDECKCKGKGCSRCRVMLVLKKKGPCTVYAKDLKSTDKTVQPIDENLIIVKLSAGQEVDLVAVATLGTSTEHSRWQPAIIGYQYHPSIKINEKCNKCGKCIRACPKDALAMVNKKVKLKAEYNCDLCNACVEACPKKAIEVIGDESKVIFNIESISGLKPRDIVLRATEGFSKQLKEFAKEVK